MFNKWEAQRWWGENYDRIVELYNVVTFSGRLQGCSTPVSSVDDSVLVGIATPQGSLASYTSSSTVYQREKRERDSMHSSLYLTDTRAIRTPLLALRTTLC